MYHPKHIQTVYYSMFLIKIIVEELKSYVTCREFLIKSHFADVFSIIMKESKELVKASPRANKIKSKRKKTPRRPKLLCHKVLSTPKLQTGQSILFVNNIENLILNMKKYPMELSLWSKRFPEYKIASTNIMWNAILIDYLKKINEKKEPQPVSVKGEYNVFDEITSRRMAVIKLEIKLSYLAESFTDRFSSFSKETPRSIYANFNSKSNIISSTNSGQQLNINKDIGIIKTRWNIKSKKLKKDKRVRTTNIFKKQNVRQNTVENIRNTGIMDNKVIVHQKVYTSLINLLENDTNMNRSNQIIPLIKSKSCSSMNKHYLNLLNYIFGDNYASYGKQVYCVRYFTVENDHVGSSVPSKNSPKLSKPGSLTVSIDEINKSLENVDSSKKSSLKERYKLKLCDKDCLNKKIDTDSCNLSICSLDIPNNNEIVKCKRIKCSDKAFRKLPSPVDDRILLDLTHLKSECCIQKSKEGLKIQDTDEKNKKEKKVAQLEEVIGGIKAKLQFGQNPCYCECECRFGFLKKTTYCNVCGGFESLGEDSKEKRQLKTTFPCPIYHKLADKPKTKTSTTGSDSKKLSKRKSTSIKSIESEKETIKDNKNSKNKFKFNYGYTGIPPHIGHSRCALPCNGTLNQVPKNMGWLWTADNIPGMKFRALWKPGAVNKHVLRLLRIAKNPNEAFAKKKRKKDTGKPKRPLKRPLLIIHKKDGEFTVTMETMKTYNKPRTISQVPYEDKPALTYIIGRTDEENQERRKKKEKAQRRLERCQRKFINSAFKDMCQEICLKTYQQALGLLPDTEKPDCICYPAEPGPDRTDFDYSCSCSEDSKLISSDTDSDEWIVEFTPPSAKFDQSYKCKKIVLTENSTQYDYLDYRVKLLDRLGNPVPRFFKGPDGKEQCSDLGGFWSPDNKWLEINIDGYVGPDGKWVPHIFCGPNGEVVDAEAGKFQAMDGTWLVVGIDGYVDSQGKWRFYANANVKENRKKNSSLSAAKRGAGDRKEIPLTIKKSQATWSCFGDASPKQLSKMGIMGHGHNRKLLLDTLKQLINQGHDIKIPDIPSVPRSYPKGRGKRSGGSSNLRRLEDRKKCRHPTPSDKGIVAIDAHGNKIYFRLKNYKSRRSEDRLATLTHHGISISSFHVPCFHSFISNEIMKKEQYDRLVALSKGHDHIHNQPEHRFHDIVT